MEVICLGDLIIGPRGFLHAGKDDPGGSIPGLLFRPDVPFTIFRLRITTRLFEPWMFNRCMVHNQIDEQAHPSLPASACKLYKVSESAVSWIYAVVIGNVVSVVFKGRWLK